MHFLVSWKNLFWISALQESTVSERWWNDKMFVQRMALGNIYTVKQSYSNIVVFNIQTVSHVVWIQGLKLKQVVDFFSSPPARIPLRVCFLFQSWRQAHLFQTRRETERNYWRATAAHTYLHRRWRTWWELPKATVGRWVWAGGRARRRWWARWRGKRPWCRREPGCRWTWPSSRRWCRGFLRRCHPPDKPALLWSLRHTDTAINIYLIWVILKSKMGSTVTEIIPGFPAFVCVLSVLVLDTSNY